MVEGEHPNMVARLNATNHIRRYPIEGGIGRHLGNAVSLDPEIGVPGQILHEINKEDGQVRAKLNQE